MTFDDYLNRCEFEFIDLLSEEEEYIEFCNFVDNSNVITEGLLDKLTGKLKSKLDFMRKLSTKLNVDLTSLVGLFRDSRVFKFFHRIGWSFDKLYGLLKKGFQLGNVLADAIAEYISQTRVAKWTEEEVKKLDAFLKRHPKARRIIGIGVAAILIYIWFNMTFTGDFGYDFGMDDVLAALAGSFSLANIFTGKNGIKLLMLFTSGVLGVSFPWPGAGSIKFLSAILQTLVRKLKLKVPNLSGIGESLKIKDYLRGT